MSLTFLLRNRWCSFYLQARPSLRRSAFASVRFSSTSSKPVSLKERLSEIIPKEIENVCSSFFLSSNSFFSLPLCRSKPFVLSTVKNLLVLSLWTNFMGTFVRCPTFLLVQTFFLEGCVVCPLSSGRALCLMLVCAMSLDPCFLPTPVRRGGNPLPRKNNP